jgi:ABC-type multidrug transport system fused ATPase/permease subunit
MYYMLNGLLHELRTRFLNGIFQIKFVEFEKIDKSNIRNLLIRDCDRVCSGVKYLTEASVYAINAFAYIVFVSTLNFSVSVVSVVVGIFVIFFLKYITRAIKEDSYIITDLTAVMGQYISEVLKAGKYLKITNSHPLIFHKFSGASRQLSNTYANSSFKLTISRNVTEPVSIFLIVTMLAISKKMELASTQETMVILFLFHRAFSQLSCINQRLQNFAGVYGAVDNYNSLMNQVNESCEKPSEGESLDLINNVKVTMDNFYINKTKILSEMDFEFGKSFTVLMGKSGAGKTTMLNILSTLYRVDKYKINNKDLDTYNLNLIRERNGYVPQDVVIFNDTLRNNLTLWSEYSDKEVIEILKIVRLDSLYEKFGLDYELGHDGGNLSGGEKQRIAIGREILRKPLILFVDEATSALDVSTEKVVLSILKDISGSIPVLMISHRLEVLNYADRVVLLEDGRILKDGTPDSFKQSPEFAEFIKK